MHVLQLIVFIMYVIGNSRNPDKVVRNGSISSDDDMPLTKMRDNSYHSLFKLSVEKCEFCDRVFNNRYDNIVHNAKHIIIPLAKQTIHQCPECLFCFVSKLDLCRHSNEKHHNVKVTLEDISKLLNNIIKNKPMAYKDAVQCKTNDNIQGIIRKPLCNDASLLRHRKLNGNDFVEKDARGIKRDDEHGILQSIVEREPKIVCHNDLSNIINMQNMKEEVTQDDKVQLLQSIVKNEPYVMCGNNINVNDKVKNETNEILRDIVEKEPVIVCSYNMVGNDLHLNDRVKKDADDILRDIVQKEPVIVCHEIPIVNDTDPEATRYSVPTSGVRNKLVFEDDFDDDIICLDELDSPVNVIDVPDEVYTPSVHYEELKERGFYCCRTCPKTFENRYDKITHETLHIGFRSTRYGHCNVCDKYIHGNYHNVNAHMRLRHKDEISKAFPVIKRNCKRCGLRYHNYSKHCKNYHILLGPEPKDECNTKKVECNANKIECNTNKNESKMSEFPNADPDRNIHCTVSFIKICDTCYMFFKDKQNVKYKFIKVINELGMRQTCQSCSKQYFEIKLIKKMSIEEKRAYKRKTKYYTNEDRLKNIQQRMKMLKYTGK